MTLTKSLVLALCTFLSTSLAAEPANLNLLKQKIEQYQSSGEYLREVDQVISRACKYVEQQVARNASEKHPKKLALVLDIDETSISNFNKIKVRDYSNNVQLIHKEILAADSPAILPTLKLYNYAIKHGVKVFFVTGRKRSEESATIKNLKFAGYTSWSKIYFRPDGYRERSIVPFKAGARKAITQQGFTILASIGDQASDVIGGYANKSYKLPNPFYFIH